MNQRTNLSVLSVVAAVLVSAAACVTDESANINLPPIANAGADQHHAYNGQPVTVTLDGTASYDPPRQANHPSPDPRIKKYQWQSGNNLPDGGGDALDPDDVAKPEITLDEGVWRFNLWVTDNEGSVSKPAQVTIAIGDDPVAECIASARPRVTEACRTCACDRGAECAEAVSACDDDCWERIACVRTHCPSRESACISDKCAGDATAVELLTGIAADECIALCPAAAGCVSALDPVFACAANAGETSALATQRCRACVCGQEDADGDPRMECVQAAPACDDACWAKVGCIVDNCPMGEASCISANCAGGSADTLANAEVVSTCLTDCEGRMSCSAAWEDQDADGGT